jgi:hypothetical protein
LGSTDSDGTSTGGEQATVQTQRVVVHSTQGAISTGGSDAFAILPEYSVCVGSFEVGLEHAEFVLRIERENDSASNSSVYARSWVTYRTFRDFSRLHEMLKKTQLQKMKRALLPARMSTSAFSQNDLDPAKLEAQRARCAFSGRNLHSRMPLVPTPARLKQSGV